MANDRQVIKWQFYLGFILIVTGGLFLADQLLEIEIMSFFWPLLVVLFGLTFFVAMLVSGKRVSGLAIPGAVITTVGLLLFIQNTFDLWVTWAYAWALLISATGLGLLIMNIYYHRLGLRRAAGIVIAIGLILFVVFGFLFEVILDLTGTDIYSGVFLGSGLVLLGLFVIFSRALFARGRKATPVADAGQPVTVETAERDEEAQQPLVVETPQPKTEVPEYSGLYFKSFGEVYLEQTEGCDFHIEGPDEILAKIKTEVRDGNLSITFDKDDIDWTDPQLRHTQPNLRYFVTFKQLTQVNFLGAGNIHAEGLIGEDLKLIHTGVGELLLKGLKYQNLKVHFGGLGEIQLDGQVQSQQVRVSGMGEYVADNLQCQTAEVDLSGAGSAKIWVLDELRAVVSGAGSIQYKGSPKLTEENTGIGSIKPL